jgi:hypothetical protein
VSTAGMRELLLRVQRDPAFAELVRERPEAAAAGFDVEAAEIELLRRPDWSLHRFLVPAHRIGERFAGQVGQPNSVDMLNHPPDQQHPPLTLELPPTTLPDLSNLHPPTEHPPTEHPPTEHPPPPTEHPPTETPTQEPPPRRPGELDLRGTLDLERLTTLRDEVLTAGRAVRQERIVALLEAIGG